MWFETDNLNLSESGNGSWEHSRNGQWKARKQVAAPLFVASNARISSKVKKKQTNQNVHEHP